MTARYDIDRQLSDWLHADAPAHEPEHLLGQVLARTARTRRRSAWRIPERWISVTAITSKLAPAAPVPWRFIGVALLLLLAATLAAIALVGSARHPAPPYGLAANGNLVYSTGGDLYSRANPFAPARTIVATGDNDTNPMVSLDGTRIAYLRNATDSSAELWVAGVDGTDQHKLALPYQTLSWVEWSPQGDSLIVLSDEDRTAITLVRVDGAAPTRLDVGMPAEAATFRPVAGNQILFRGTDDAGDRGLYLVNRDGSGLARLELDTGFQTDLYYLENQPYYFDSPAWSPDGTQLAFHTLEPAPDSPAGPGFRIHIANVSAAGAVTDEEILEFDPGMDDEFAPYWLPTGDAIVYQTIEGITYRLMLAPLGTGAPAPHDLGVQGLDSIGVAVSPDGTQVIVQVPPKSGAAPLTSIVNLASGAIEPADLADDVSWQRAAP
jgi:hypothetical protein